jgi:hydrogenase expression/formation protein HypC
MCLAIPGKIVELVPGPDPLALVDVMGVRRRVDVSMVFEQGLEIGDWVLFHVGFAMSKISGEAADEQMRLLRMLGEADSALEEVRGYGSAESPPPDAWPGSPPDP